MAHCTDKTRTDRSFVLLVYVRIVRMFGKSLQERGKNLENYLYYPDPFFAYNNALYIERTINGKPVNIKLSNFLARITEDITCTNGAENERFLSIVGTDDKGNDLRKITVPLKNFAQLDWAQEYWGINCVIESGYDLKKRNDVRESAKRLRRQFLRYKDAEIVYSLQHKKILELASEAGAIYRMDGTVLINRDIFEEYHPNHRYALCGSSFSLYFYVRLCAYVVHGADT